MTSLQLNAISFRQSDFSKPFKLFFLTSTFFYLLTSPVTGHTNEPSMPYSVGEFNDQNDREACCNHKHHKKHHRGATGPTGPTGPIGIGATGPTGATAIVSAIIPYTSGQTTVVMTSDNTGAAYTGSIIGFGSSLQNILLTPQITLPPTTNFSFSVPTDGIISSISASFRSVPNSTLATITVKAQIYEALASSDSFTPIPGAVVAMEPSLTGNILQGTLVNGSITGLNIPVSLGTRLLLVYFITTTGGSNLSNTLYGDASAGIAISATP